jgi:uncharacterized iron-regulated protein
VPVRNNHQAGSPKEQSVTNLQCIALATALMRMAALLLAVIASACTTTTAVRSDWESRLQGNALVLLGEVHDNPELHRRRLNLLRRAFVAGWRPVIAMEQFDREHQADIERARREKPDDAQHVIDLAAPARTGSAGGWNWELYLPVVALALEYHVPLIAANLSRSDAEKVVHDGYAAVFDSTTRAAWGLDQAIDPDWQASQEREIDTGHCHALPKTILPALARAQFARDSVMAAILRAHAAQGVVLLAGNGHVRRDIGVPQWLDPAMRALAFSLGYLEKGDATAAAAFDAVVYGAPAARAPPCAQLEKRIRSP